MNTKTLGIVLLELAILTSLFAQLTAATTIAGPGNFHGQEIQKIIDYLRLHGFNATANNIELYLNNSKIIVEPLDGGALGQNDKFGGPIYVDPGNFNLPPRGWNTSNPVDVDWMMSLTVTLVHEKYHSEHHGAIDRITGNGKHLLGGGNPMETDAWTHALNFLDKLINKTLEEAEDPAKTPQEKRRLLELARLLLSNKLTRASDYDSNGYGPQIWNETELRRIRDNVTNILNSTNFTALRTVLNSHSEFELAAMQKQQSFKATFETEKQRNKQEYAQQIHDVVAILTPEREEEYSIKVELALSDVEFKEKNTVLYIESKNGVVAFSEDPGEVDYILKLSQGTVAQIYNSGDIFKETRALYETGAVDLSLISKPKNFLESILEAIQNFFRAILPGPVNEVEFTEETPVQPTASSLTCETLRMSQSPNCNGTCSESQQCIQGGLLENGKKCYICTVKPRETTAENKVTETQLNVPTFSINRVSISPQGRVSIKGRTSSNSGLIKTAVIADVFNGQKTIYPNAFNENKTEFTFNETLPNGRHVLLIESETENGVKAEVEIFNGTIGPVYCCTEDYRVYWNNQQVDSIDKCPALENEQPSKKGYSTAIEAEHMCIFGWICKQPEGQWVKVRGEEHRSAVNQGYTTYARPGDVPCNPAPGYIAENASIANASANGTNATFELLNINQSYARVETLPFGNQVHFVIASTSIDVRTQLPITIVLTVSGEQIYSAVIPNDPVGNCRGADGCSIDGPVLSNNWRSRPVTLQAKNNAGSLLAQYTE